MVQLFIGICVDKPENGDLRDVSDFLYTTLGTVTSKNGYEFDFYGEYKFVSVVVISARDNIIKLEVFGIIFTEMMHP
jgi:hypothetical protein